MKTFKSYLEEALTSPAPYYLTVDTEMPRKIYGAFDIGGGKYSIAMIESSIPGVFYVEMGRTSESGGKVQYWKFHSPKDIIPALSTLINFSDATVKLMGKQKFKGAAIKIRKSVANKSLDRAINIANRIVRTKFKDTLKMLPVSQEGSETKYGSKFIFIAGRNQDYKKIFSGDKNFDNYDFSSDMTLDVQGAEKIKPKQPLKKTVSIKPSSKYTFAGLDVDIPSSLDSETVEKLSNVKIQDAESSETKQMKDSDSYKKDLNFIKKIIPVEKSVVSLPGLKSMIDKIYQYGFDKNKLNWNDLKYIVSNLSAPEKDVLSAYGLIDIDSPTVKSDWMTIMKKIPQTYQSPEVKSFIKNNPNGNKAAAEPYEPGSSNKATKKVSNVKPTEFISTIPGASNEPVSVSETGQVWKTKEDVTKKTNHVFYDMGYVNELPKITNFKTMVSYTGSKYSSFNNPLRNTVSKLLKGEKLSKSEMAEIIAGQSKFQKLAKMFEKVKPLPEAIWVYRGTHIPSSVKDKIEPGYQYVDPGFLSTSLNPSISFGYDKMRIFLPKGSKVLPALGHSNHSAEKEVILPPSSVIKVIETETPEDSNKLFVQGVFMGSAFKSITDALKKQLTIAEENISILQAIQLVRMIEQMQKEEDTEEYNPEDKYGGEYDFDLADIINQKIKNGEYKIEGPKSEDD